MSTQAEDADEVAGPSAESAPPARHRHKHIPKFSTLFILGTQFLECFNFFGLQATLKKFLVDEQNHSEENAKIIVMTFTFFSYVFSVFGAVFGDSYLGRFGTVILGSVIYIAGGALLAANANMELPTAEMALIFIAFGAGCLRPCLAALAGDQYELQQQLDQHLKIVQLSNFFVFFYLTINVAAIGAIYLLPLAMETFGFWMPTAIMGMALAVFIIGRAGFKVAPTSKNSVRAIRMLCCGLRLRVHHRRPRASEIKVDYIEAQYDVNFPRDLVRSLQILIVLIPMPIFWALYYLHFDLWPMELYRMNRFCMNNLIVPDDFSAIVNPICVILLLPIIHFGIYPLIGYLQFLRRRPMQRIVAGGIFAGVAYLLAAATVNEIDHWETANGTDALYSNPDGWVNFLILNGQPCDVDLSLDKGTLNGTQLLIPKFDLSLRPRFRFLNETLNTSIHATSECTGKNSYIFSMDPNMSYLLSIMHHIFWNLISLQRAQDGQPIVKSISEIKWNASTTDVNSVEFYYNDELKKNVMFGNEEELPFPNYYDIKVNNQFVRREQLFSARSIYIVSVYGERANGTETYQSAVFQIAENDRLTYMRIMIQYVVLGIAEALFVVSGYEFIYVEAPASMKCLVQACWLLMVAIGIILMYILKAVINAATMYTNYITYACVMFVDIAVFAILAIRYDYNHYGIY